MPVKKKKIGAILVGVTSVCAIASYVIAEGVTSPGAVWNVIMTVLFLLMFFFLKRDGKSAYHILWKCDKLLGCNMLKNIERIFDFAFFASLFIPFVAFEKHHNCHYDECMRIFHIADDRIGMCIESVIDDVCMGIAVLWLITISGSALILSKIKNAISPFVVALLFIVASIVLACMDPSKWEFVISLIFSFVLFIVAAYLDSKQNTIKNTK